MQKILISLPDDLADRFRAAVPDRMRSKTITKLIEKEIERHERKLYEAALAVEQDQELAKEMKDWDVTLDDGLNDETW